jgi:hypothetical protein
MSHGSDQDMEGVVSAAKAGRRTIEELRSELSQLQALLEWQAIKERAFKVNRDQNSDDSMPPSDGNLRAA